MTLTFSRRLALLPALAVFALGCSQRPAPSTFAILQGGAAADGGNPTAMSAAELDRRTAALFGDVAQAQTRLSVDSALLGGGDAGPSWDIDVHSYATFDRVRHYVSAFSGSAADRISARLSEGTRYEPMIRAKLGAAGLPEDMYYLALVESGFNPHAYSRAAAVGMWQFMTATGKGMGLRIDWWIDERRDPVRSTDAAARFLRGLNEQFGSLYLAAAAYNGGPGRVARGLNRYEEDLEGTTGDDLFFALAKKKYLRSETSNYVPQLIAAALVAKEPERYGLTINRREPFEYDSVNVGRAVPLTAIARASGTTLEVIQELNPHILRGMTPPTGRDSNQVRIPVGSRVRFDSAYATLTEEERTGVHRLKATRTSTWSSLARKTGVSARAVSNANPKVKANRKTGRIAAGTTVLVPTKSVVAGATGYPDPAIERYGTGTRTHVVRAGENLSVIARRYKTTAAAIMRLNRLKKAMIFPGQELRVRR